MYLGEVIKKYRIENDLSMADFADRSGISKAYVSLLEKNKHPKTGQTIAPSLIVIRRAAKAMNMNFDDLFAMLNGDVTLSPEPEEESAAPISDQFLEKNKPASTFEEMRTVYARNRNKLSKEERMKLAAEILQDEEDI